MATELEKAQNRTQHLDFHWLGEFLADRILSSYLGTEAAARVPCLSTYASGLAKISNSLSTPLDSHQHNSSRNYAFWPPLIYSL